MAEIDYLHPLSYGEILPGYELLRATRAGRDVPAGALFLSTGHGPNVVITTTPLPDPGCDDEGEDRDLPDDEWVYELQVALGEHLRTAEALEEALHMDPMAGHRLIEAAKKAGYDPDRHGYRFASWLAHRIAVRLEKVAPTRHPAGSVTPPDA